MASLTMKPQFHIAGDYEFVRDFADQLIQDLQATWNGSVMMGGFLAKVTLPDDQAIEIFEQRLAEQPHVSRLG